MDENVLKAIEALKQNFVRSLPAKIDEIKLAWESYLQKPDKAVIEEVYRKTHSLAGSGATFNQIELGKSAKSLENYIKLKLEGNQILMEESVSHINKSLVELRSLLNREVDDNVNKNTDNPVTTEIHSKPAIPMKKCTRTMKILVVDDEMEIRERTRLILEADGHSVVQASDCKNAIEMFEKEQPDLILMDVIMPGCDGVAATKEIKTAAGNRFVPVIFVTSVNDMQRLASFIEAGGDDFLIKPVEPMILNAKMQAFSRINEMYQKLNEYQVQTEVELETSKHLLDTLLNLDSSEIEKIDYWAASPGHFSGDLRLIKKLDDGEILMLLCDFTGHGLPAAIGTIFVADLFRSMTRKSFNAQFILDEINEKMHQILPTGRYCAAIMVSFKPEAETVSVWNCGLPSVFLLGDSNKIIHKIDSGHVPLGVLGGALRYPPKLFSSKTLSHIVLFSDGLTESQNPEGCMYSEERLISRIESVGPGESVFNRVKMDVEQFMDGTPPADDISFIVLNL